MERQVCAEEGYTDLQESNCSQANECSYAEEIVSDDEGALGGEEKAKKRSLRSDRCWAEAGLLSASIPTSAGTHGHLICCIPIE
jgi:hypothetical protein